jgi:hypothetical protein
MIGALVAFGLAAGSPLIAVLAHRAISFWLPTLPGIAGYLALRSTVRGWRTADAKNVSSGQGRHDDPSLWRDEAGADDRGGRPHADA